MRVSDQEFFWYWLVNIPHIGNKAIHSLLERFGHPSRMFDCQEKDLEDILEEKQIYSFMRSKDYLGKEEELKNIKEKEIKFIHWESPEYPERLRNLYDPPYGFYLKGRLPEQNKITVAVVGSRRASPYGKKMAERFSGELAGQGVVIISGMAAGIDAVAHRTALDCGGSTLGLLGGGIDTMYPKSNWNLYLDMYQNGGIMSEFNQGVLNKAGLFPMRNRLISGLSDAVLVVEAGFKSGSLITADQGMEQGKEVYAIPGRLTDPMSQGCNHLIAQGASVAEDPMELLRDLKELHPFYQNDDTERKRMNSIKQDRLELSKEEGLIWNALDLIHPLSFDEILAITGLPMGILQEFLVKMEMNNSITQPQQNLYLKNC